MPDMTPAPRRRPLWRLFIMPALAPCRRRGLERLLALCSIRGRRSRRCLAVRRRRNPAGSMIAASVRSPASRSASRSVAADASVTLVSQTATAQAPFTARLGRNPGRGADLRSQIVDRRIQGACRHRRSWSGAVVERELEPSAAAACVGLPDVPQRASIVFDNPSIDRINGPVPMPLARANHVELHGRVADGSPAGSIP